LFTDGSFPDGKPGSPLKPWIGGVFFKTGEVPLQFGCEVDKSLIKKWLTEKTTDRNGRALCYGRGTEDVRESVGGVLVAPSGRF